MIRRRRFVPALLGAALGAHAWAQGAGRAERPPGHFIAASALQQAVDRRFPLRHPVAGLLDLDVQSPRLRLLPARNRVAAAFEVQAAGLALNRRHSGWLALDFALRYEPADRSLRAHQLQLDRLDIPSLQARVVELLNRVGPALVAESLQEVVLHQFSAEDMALPTRLGLQPGPITVTAEGLVVAMVPRPL